MTKDISKTVVELLGQMEVMILGCNKDENSLCLSAKIEKGGEVIKATEVLYFYLKEKGITPIYPKADLASEALLIRIAGEDICKAFRVLGIKPTSSEIADIKKNLKVDVARLSKPKTDQVVPKGQSL